MNSRANHFLSKHRPRGFESLEARYALDGSALASTSLPTPRLTALPVIGVAVYAAPVGPLPAPAAPAIATGSSATILQPIPTAYLQRLGNSLLPIGPARPANLPSQASPPVVVSPPAAASLSADGTLPNNQTPANLPTTRQSMPVDPDPPGIPSFTLVPSLPRR